MKSRSDLVLILALVGVPRAAFAQAPVRTNEEPLDALRERFKGGMERYRAGRYADAILIWEQIYRELGNEKGYRLAYNLGRAHDAYGNATHAAEYYEIFVTEVGVRRTRGETLEPNVVEQDVETANRLKELAAANGRIRFRSGPRAHVAQIDHDAPRVGSFVAYVSPGRHSVLVDPGPAETRRDLDVAAGAIVDVEPTAEIVPTIALEPSLPMTRIRWDTRKEAPFSPTLLWVAGAATVASVVVPIATYAHALSVKGDYDREASLDRKRALASDYDSAKSTAYATVAIPLAILAATAGLGAWYVTSAREVRVQAGGSSIVVSGRF